MESQVANADQVQVIEAKTEQSRGFIAKIDTVISAVFILAIFLHASSFYDLFGRIGLQTVLLVELLTYAYYIVVATARGHVGIAIGATLFAIFLIVEAYIFGEITGNQLNLNVCLSQAGLLSAVVFYETKSSTKAIIGAAISFAAVYLLVYDLFWKEILNIVGQDSSLWLPADGSRGVRLFLASPFAIFAILYGLFKIRNSVFFGSVMTVMGVYALIISESRFSAVVTFSTIVAGICGRYIPLLRRPINITLSLAFLIATFIMLVGLTNSDWNPYSFLASDSSGNARFVEYRSAQYVFDGRILTGIGLPASFDDLQSFIKPTRPFFISDLGAFGLGFQYGMPFAMIITVLCLNLILVPKLTLNERKSGISAVLYTAQNAAFGSFFVSLVPNVGATFFIGVALAYYKHRRLSRIRSLHSTRKLSNGGN